MLNIVLDERRSQLSIYLSNKKIPKEAIQALKIIEKLLDSILVGVYLYGSAVMEGLRINSDVDILVVTNHSLSERTRRELTDRLMTISGKIGNTNAMRPLEVTVINQVRKNGINLSGPKATEVLEPVPMTDIRRAIKESLPGLIADIKGDERNVILTLARMGNTSITQ